MRYVRWTGPTILAYLLGAFHGVISDRYRFTLPNGIAVSVMFAVGLFFLIEWSVRNVERLIGVDEQVFDTQQSIVPELLDALYQMTQRFKPVGGADEYALKFAKQVLARAEGKQ